MKKKRVRAGHKASATRNIGRAEELLSEEYPDDSTLICIKMSLQEKLDTLKNLDGEIVNLLDGESVVVDDIEQSDTCIQLLLEPRGWGPRCPYKLSFFSTKQGEVADTSLCYLLGLLPDRHS